MKRVYVAGGSGEVDLCGIYIRELRAMGLQITHDWTFEVNAQRRKGQTDRSLSAAARARAALVDLDAVRLADIVWLLVPEVSSFGCWVELGAALVSGRHVVISGDHQRTIFAEHAHKQFDDHDTALAWFRERATEWRQGGAAE